MARDRAGTVITVQDGLQGAYSENLARDCGDFIIRRSDGVYAYQLAVVTDDAPGGVTEVIRGRDLLSSVPRQMWLQKTLGFPTPAYYHVPLLLAPDGRAAEQAGKIAGSRRAARNACAGAADRNACISCGPSAQTGSCGAC